MSERDAATFSPEKPSSCSCLLLLLHVLFDSLKIFSRNKRVFASIYALQALPLSFLIFSLSAASHPIKAHVHRLESYVALRAATRFEARHVWREARSDALFLFLLKSLFLLPSLPLSLLSAISAVNSASASSLRHLRPSPLSTTWQSPLATTICSYALSFLLSHLVPALSAASPAELRLLVWLFGSGLEVYLMAVTGMALVVSIVEDRVGWDAIRVGSGIMEGKRVVGWVLSGLMVLVSGGIGWRMERLTAAAMKGRSGTWWAVTVAVLGEWERVGLVCLYGVVVVGSYVVATVFYWECKKRHDVRGEDECGGIVDGGENIV